MAAVAVAGAVAQRPFQSGPHECHAGGTRTCIHTPGAGFTPEEMTPELVDTILEVGWRERAAFVPLITNPPWAPTALAWQVGATLPHPADGVPCRFPRPPQSMPPAPPLTCRPMCASTPRRGRPWCILTAAWLRLLCCWRAGPGQQVKALGLAGRQRWHARSRALHVMCPRVASSMLPL